MDKEGLQWGWGNKCDILQGSPMCQRVKDTGLGQVTVLMNIVSHLFKREKQNHLESFDWFEKNQDAPGGGSGKRTLPSIF